MNAIKRSSTFISTPANAGLNDNVDSDAVLATTNGTNSSVIANVIVGAPGTNNLTLSDDSIVVSRSD